MGYYINEAITFLTFSISVAVMLANISRMNNAGVRDTNKTPKSLVFPYTRVSNGVEQFVGLRS